MRKLIGAESLAGLIGLGLVALGVVGFVPGIVQDYGALQWWRGSSAELFGVFQTSILIDLVHIGAGVLGLGAGPRGRTYLGVIGSAFFGLGVYGLLVDDAWNFMPFDRAADWLHIGLGIGIVYAGVAAGLAALRPAATS